nr:MAG TPA: hypothetical protein [Caudoviricetes sp.]
MTYQLAQCERFAPPWPGGNVWLSRVDGLARVGMCEPGCPPSSLP